MVEKQKRTREYGITPGVLPPGPRNDLTDISGVRVGQVSRCTPDGACTGVTAIRPHGGNLFLERVPAGLSVANGHGKLAGATQVQELGELETPIVLVNTLSVGRAVEAVVDWTLSQPGCEAVRSVNAFVAETNDSPLNAIRQRGLSGEDVLEALEAASDSTVAQGSVGAGTGTMAFGLKGGIGSSSRLLPEAAGGWRVAALVQANFDGILTLDTLPLGKAMDHYWAPDRPDYRAGTGSIVMVLATDAPLSDRNLSRLARRAAAGLARTGANFHNGSGDYALAFSTHEGVRRHMGGPAVRSVVEVSNDAVSGLFLAAIEATEEAIYDALLLAAPQESRDELDGRRVLAESLGDKAGRWLRAREADDGVGAADRRG